MKVKKTFLLKQVSFFALFLFVALLLFVFLYQRTRANVLGTTDTTTTSTVKELYVPLGTGSNTTTDWSDVKGAAGYIDTRLYGKMKKVVFEASIGVPSGSQIAYVRLYNATDKHPVWYTEMNISSAGPELLISSPITLDSGNKLYQVQMKSQLGATTNLLQSRVHISMY
ncbi:MAG: hypothetical protein V1917_04705 [Candidatus Gottesmanbacteria bacterium]